MSVDNRAPGQIGPAAACRACGTLVVWCGTSKQGESVAVEAIPSPNGTHAVYTVGGGLHAAPVKPGQAAGMRAAGNRLYLRHAPTCAPAKRAEAGK